MKLDKLVFDNQKKEKINDSVLDKAQQAMAQTDQKKKKRVFKNNLFRKAWIGAASAIVCTAIVLAVVLPITLHKNTQDAIPETRPEEDVFYCYDGNYEKSNYASIKVYNQTYGTNFWFFESEREQERETYLYRHKGKDALLQERILFMDTYEEIMLHVSSEKYVFDFLDTYRHLNNKIVLNRIEISYETVFNKDTYLFNTKVSFTEDKNAYSILFQLEGETMWQDFLKTL